MKKFLFILLIIGLYSCNNTPIKVDDPKKATTVELQQLAAIDSNCYKVVEQDNKLYVLQNGMVIKRVVNQSGDNNTFGLIIFIELCIIMLLIVILSN